MKIIDIIMITIGGLAVITYLVLKVLQVAKFKKLVKEYMEQGLSEIKARENAYRLVYNKKKVKDVEEKKEDQIYEE